MMMVLVACVIMVVIVLRFRRYGFGRRGKGLFFGRLCGAQSLSLSGKILADVLPICDARGIARVAASLVLIEDTSRCGGGSNEPGRTASY